MKIYAISGLGADKRVFERLHLNHEIIHLDWLIPAPNEQLTSYAKRLSAAINTHEDFVILGVSFGGLVAVEISKLLNPKACILISSAETHWELRKLFRLIGKIGLLKLIPTKLFKPPKQIAHFLFGAENKATLNNILDDTDLDFVKWASTRLCEWANEQKIKSCIKIAGTKDKILPPSKDINTILIHNGEHFMIYDKANEVSHIINEKLKEIEPKKID